MTNQYVELQNKHQQEFNEFPLFFAFSHQQLKEGMEKLGLTVSDGDQVYALVGGGYYRKTDALAYRQMLERQNQEMMSALKGDKTGKGFVYDMFSYELANHEYGYTCDIEDTLDALDLTLEDVNALPNLRNGLALAIQSFDKQIHS